MKQILYKEKGGCVILMDERPNRWDDHYARRARRENWLARSVYKLEEIDLRFRILKKGQRVLDLGCFPGSWSQYALMKVGPHGRVIGVDLKRPEKLAGANFCFLQADVLELDPLDLRKDYGEINVVLSDLAPSTTGIRDADCARSLALAAQALEIAGAVLAKGGLFVCKIFEGEDLQSLRSSASKVFESVRLFRPAATRKRSREVYVLGFQAKSLV
jgi:23S rRNA (uridine2552-2'-O)-methyltransferase